MKPVLALLVCLGSTPRLLAQDSTLPLDRLTPQRLEAYVDSAIAVAGVKLDRLLAARGPRTVENTLRPYDALRGAVNRARVASLLRVAHPDSAIRSAATRAESRLEAFTRGLRLEPRLYRVVLAIDTLPADPETREYLAEERAAFRRSGVDRDERTRVSLGQLLAGMLQLEQRFEANLRSDTTTAAFREEELEGLPPDWIAARSRNSAGAILVAGEQLQAVVSLARRADVRERALVAAMNRAPGNRVVLDSLLRVRHAYAALLGYSSWAAYQLETTMARSPDGVHGFLDELRRRAEPSARGAAEAARRDSPRGWIAVSDLVAATPGGAEAFGRRGLGPLAAVVRQYFPWPAVRDGLFALSRELMDVDFRPAPDLPGWTPTVEVYRVYDRGRLVAVAYLDVRARLGRSVQGASTNLFRGGIRGGPPIEVAILGGMVPPDPALLGPQAVFTLFHEFGHLLHAIVSVRPWYWTSFAPPEADFAEVPSTLFEQWAHDTTVLRRIARHYQTGAPVPDSLLARMAAAGPRGGDPLLQWRARLSLGLHEARPGTVDSVVQATFRESLPPGVDIRLPDTEIHPEQSFSHLASYGARYYTYPWSNVISLDLLSRFTRGLLDTAMVRAYRRELLDVGGSRTAMASLQAFLGRPFSLDAWARTLP